MRGLAAGLGVFFLMQGCLRLDLIPLSLLVKSVPPALFLLPWLAFGVAFLALLFQPVATILAHGRRVPAGSAPTPGFSRALLLGFHYDLELQYFRFTAVRFCRTLMGLSWWLGSMVCSAFACAVMVQGGQLENQGVPLLQAMLNFFLAFALLSLPLFLWICRRLEDLIERAIQGAASRAEAI